jgi:hypothetical protein
MIIKKMDMADLQIIEDSENDVFFLYGEEE